MMRALVMDFPTDMQALNINDQYMFGKSILVCPVTNAMYSKDTNEDFSTVGSRELYLPKGTDWIDFWTGKKKTGGQKIIKEAPVDIIPLYVRAGSILPIGPDVQYAEEKKWDNLEIRIYDGANGEFTLYQDENDNYNYEKGVYSTISFSWNDSKKILTINDRNGTFPGMSDERNFKIVRIKGTGEVDNVADTKVIAYKGKKIQAKF
jgi:alpha-D-xyloside xylohydrolase